MSDFLARLKSVEGEPARKNGKKRSPLRLYVEKHFADIDSAYSAGYSFKQIANFIKEEIGEQVTPERLSRMKNYVKKRKNPPQVGLGVSYSFVGESKTYKIFVPKGESVEKVWEDIKKQTGKSVFIEAEKPMTAKDFRKWKL